MRGRAGTFAFSWQNCWRKLLAVLHCDHPSFDIHKKHGYWKHEQINVKTPASRQNSDSDSFAILDALAPCEYLLILSARLFALWHLSPDWSIQGGNKPGIERNIYIFTVKAIPACSVFMWKIDNTFEYILGLFSSLTPSHSTSYIGAAFICWKCLKCSVSAIAINVTKN